ncbi:hypothetical protein [Streptomyces sp. NPDC020996]
MHELAVALDAMLARLPKVIGCPVARRAIFVVPARAPAATIALL